MGLNLVEMVYRLEEEFEITIPDEAAEKMTTPRIVIDYLMSRPEVSEKWSRDYVVISVWQIIEDQGGISREDFNDDSRFIEDMNLT
jgi:acyl carrier protein